MDYTRRLAEFCTELTFEKIPEDVLHKTKLCVLDYIANVYGSLELEAVNSVAKCIRALGGSDQATALGCGFRTGIQNAAFLNGTTAEAIEAQDGLRFGGNHPVCAVIPAVFAMAEAGRNSGKEVIAGIVAGYEAASRPAAAMHPYHTLSGFLPTGTCGTFGAAAAAAKLMRVDADCMLNAFGNAGYLLPISMAEQLMGGYTVKIVQGGQAASAGIMAAELARAGITGCPQVLEGSELKGGFTQIALRAEPKFDRITEGLGEHFSIMDIYFKPYTCCRHTHGSAQAAMELARENDISPGDVEAIEVDTYGVGVIAVGKGMPANGTFVSAQFSIPYVVAACLMDGKLGPAQLTEKRIADSSLIELSKLVTVRMDDELNRVYPDKTPSRVTIRLKNGRSLVRQVDIPKGDPRDPMDTPQILGKLREFAGTRDKARIEQIAEMVMDLEKLSSLDELASLI
ncbi:MAG TPA: MmgE/PrpD family protein [Deltaproteobacteria bacterium]|nr:MmgE/PrpD family protein [Deltaproteobacteria bacterium]